MTELQNANPLVYQVQTSRFEDESDDESKCDEIGRDIISSREVFEHIRHINDPEHPLSLEQLNVVSMSALSVDDEDNRVAVEFTPTIPHCSMATLIGLSIRVKLLRCLPRRFKVSVAVAAGTHQS